MERVRDQDRKEGAELKILSKRAAVVLALIFFFLCGLVIFLYNYLKNGSSWVLYPTNQHLNTNGHVRTGTVFDRNGMVLARTAGGEKEYNDDKTVRTAVMQTVGDSAGNVATGAQVAFARQLSSWSLINGAYRFGAGQSDIRLTIDAELCATAYKALNGRKGAVSVYNYRTGEILCMVSAPSFDPEHPPDVNSDPEKYEGVFLNRVLSGSYTPGSVFKLVTAAAALDTIPDIGSRTFRCDGVYEADGGEVTCPAKHGSVSLKQALADSCNVTFAQLAIEMGADTLQKYAELAGFNSGLTVDGIETTPGKVNLSDAKGVDLGWAGIGQYTDTANPLNFMAYVGAIANGGAGVTPRLLLDSSSESRHVLSQSTADTIKEMMRYDVLDSYGDGNYRGLNLCAKSGTAQVSGGKQPNAWFVGFLDRTDCPLAFVVVIENGGGGSKVAGPVANKVLQAAVKGMTE